MRSTTLVCVLFLIPRLVPAQETAAVLLRQKLVERIRAIDAALNGALGVAVVDLAAGTRFDYHGGVVFPQASVIKVPVMITVFRKLNLDERVTLSPAEAKAGGDLYSALRRGPVTLTVRELVEHMIQSSDNTAANRLISMVGMEAVNGMLGEFGLTGTRLRRLMLDSAAVKRGEENISTPREMSALAEFLYSGKAAEPKATEEMIGILKAVDADVRKTVPPAIAVASKEGEYPGTRVETAIVYLPGRPYIVSIAATYLRPGSNPIPEVAAAVHEYFDKLARSNSYGNRIE